MVNILNNSYRLSKTKRESLDLGTKLPYFDIFRLAFEKKLLPYLKQTQIFQKAKFRAKLKVLKFETKNALFEFEYFWAGI